MMKQFLKQVASHYYGSGDISDKCFVFPNKRALAFFKKYLGEEVAAGLTPVITPACMTMNDLFYKVTFCRPTQREILLKVLYDCYRPIYEKVAGKEAESFDEFIFWGGIILNDFSDVDKYLADPEKLFTNIAQFKGMQTDFSFLSEKQRTAMEAFVGHFKDEKEYKARFQATWDVLLPLYSDFNNILESTGRSYEGMVYRKLARELENKSVKDIFEKDFPKVDTFVFVGLNALNKCEKNLLKKLRDARMAEFCWDYSSDFIKDKDNKSSFFLQENVLQFPQAFELDPEGLGIPEINVLSVPSGIGQAKQLPAILEKIGKTDISTAVVLPDETLLLPVLNSIPIDVKELNVTMGYPMNGSELWPLINDIATLQLHLRLKDGKWYFYHKQVWSILSNSIVKSLLSEEGAKCAATIHADTKYYVGEEDFGEDPLLKKIFRPVVTDISAASCEQVNRIEEYLMELLEHIGYRISKMDGMALETDFAKRIYLCVQRLSNEQLEILPTTFFRLLRELTASDTIPFEGMPLCGLQVMGPLETRALDFENVIILSCNEGTFPRKSVASSYIPPELRRGFELPTYEFQDAVWAYYFYRLIQRTSKVWMLFDSRTEGMKSGEMSRYIKQLELHFNVDIHYYVAEAQPGKSTEQEIGIKKTQEHLDTLSKGWLSASALQTYLSCPAQFFYSKIEKLNAEDEVSESLDAGMLGTVFHSTMEELYTVKDGILKKSYLETLLKDQTRISETVRKGIMENLHCFEVVGKNIIFADIIQRYVSKAIQRDIEYMNERSVDCIRIEGLELKKTMDFGGFRFIGFIDRLDSTDKSELRVVDYKTGKVTDQDFLIDEENAEIVVASVFHAAGKDRLKIPLQLYLYDEMLRRDGTSKGRNVMNSIYHTSRLFKGGVENVSLNAKFCSLMEVELLSTLEELGDTNVDWERRGDENDCKYCDFKKICGR